MKLLPKLIAVPSVLLLLAGCTIPAKPRPRPSGSVSPPVSTSPSTAPSPSTSPTAAPATYSLWTNNPEVAPDEDPASVELGVRFKSSVAGEITAIRFYQPAPASGTFQGKLWSGSGAPLGNATFTLNAATGWQSANLASPVKITPETEYVASYFAPYGRYPGTRGFFNTAYTNGPLTATAGVFKYGAAAGTFPTDTYQASNYWVDVVFKASVPDNPATVVVTPADGGSNPYKGAISTARVPIGVWYEGTYTQTEINRDKEIGLNTYVELTEGSNPSLIQSSGMDLIHSNTSWSISDGWLITDEPDMWAGAGWDAWTGKYPGQQGAICNPDRNKCGFTVVKTLSDKLPKDNKMRYVNYGKGVMFWNSASEAATFVNDFQDLVSVDTYWYTDNNICYHAEGPVLIPGSGPISQYTGKKNLTEAECRRAYNYGIVNSALRDKVNPKGSKPIWGFVETAGPFDYNKVATFIKPREIDAAVWHSLIGGARGIIYFNHTFAAGTNCESQHVLREDSRTACGYDKIRAQVKATNAKVQTVVNAVNGDFADFNGLARGSMNTSGDVTASTRWDGKNFWVLAGSTKGRGQGASQGTFNMPCVGSATATVVGENRTIPVTNGTFTDAFADDLTTHVYRIDGGSTCGLG